MSRQQTSSNHPSVQHDSWPTRHWKTRTPLALGLDPNPLGRLHLYASERPRLHSLLVVYAGSIVFEEYYQGWNQKRYHNIHSATKSVVSALVGIALHEGYLSSLDQPLLVFFPDYRPSQLDPRKQAITIRHLLSMTSGYAFENEIDKQLDKSSPVEKMLDRPMKHEPGTVFHYDDLGVHLLSHILTSVTGSSLADIARSRLFEPLGIWQDEQGNPSPWKQERWLADSPHLFFLWEEDDEALWSVDRLGYHIGGTGLQLTAREMAKFGYLYLHQGQWEGKQILSEAYVQESTRPFLPDGNYGYLWWISHLHGYAAFSARGYAGQVITVVPALDLVVVITSPPAITEEHVETILEDFVVPAAVAAL